MADPANSTGPLLLGDRPLPQSPEAERAVLSCLLQEPGLTLDSVFAKLHDENFFYSPAHRHVYSCLRDLRDEMLADRIDVISVKDRLSRNGTLDAVGGEEYLARIYSTVPTTANVDNYVDSVLDTHILRKMIGACSDVVGRCFEPDSDIEQLVDSVEREIMGITNLRVEGGVQVMKSLVKEAVDFLEALSKRDEGAIGMPTDYVDLDRLLTGLKPGDMIVLAARPSIGKTTFAMNVGQNIARKGFGVGMFSLEMGATQVALRMLCSEARINLRDVRDGKLSNAEWSNRIMPACARLAKMPVVIDDTPQISTLELRQKARRMKQEHDVKLIIIDYLQLMRPTGGNKTTNREQEVAKLSSDIKALARELDVPIMLLAQLNRQAEAGGIPKLSHLRESGAIEQDADVVLLLHRERDHERDEESIANSDAPPGAIESQVVVAKHRNGPVGVVTMNFFGQYTRFESAQRVNDEDVPQPGGGTGEF